MSREIQNSAQYLDKIMGTWSEGRSGTFKMWRQSGAIATPVKK